MSDHSTSAPTGLGHVTVVVNSFGRPASTVERALDSFLRQKHRPGKILFIDQNDRRLNLDPRFRAYPELVHQHFPNRICSAARNRALDLVPEGWIAFSDDDGYWAEDYSERLRETFLAEPTIELIAGSVIDENTGDYYSLRHKLGGNLEKFLGSKLLTGANFVVRAATFRRIGGYDLRLGPGTPWASSEEADLCWRMVTSGVRALFVPRLRLFHPMMHVAAPAEAARKAYGYGRGKGALAAMWMMERRHRFGVFEFVEMTIVPLLKMGRGVLRGRFAVLRIQSAVLRGRYRGFWEFMTGRTPS